jgi:hypothetical protein
VQSLYSPNQIGGGSFLGGPFAAVYFIWANFRALGEPSRAAAAMFWGVVFVVVILLTLPFLPEKFPNIIIPAVYSVAARLIAENYQLKKQAIADSDQYDFQSTWKVVGLALAFLAAFFVVALIWLFALDYFHVITL